MSTLSSQQVLAASIALMGEPLGVAFHALDNEMNWLHFRWLQYCELFHGEPEVIPLLNRTAGPFFRLVYMSLWEQTLLHLARITDPASSGTGKDNLTVCMLGGLIKSEPLHGEVVKAAEAAVEACAFAVQWRHKKLAHADLPTALRHPAARLPRADKDKVDVALDRLTDVINVVSMQYLGGSQLYRAMMVPPGGAESLVWALRQADTP